MKKCILIILLLFPWVVSHSQAGDSVIVVMLKPQEFRDEIRNVNNVRLIDVREFFEYKKSRIKGAVNVPSSGNIDFAADTLDKTSHLFLYCTSGFRSKRVGQRFAGKGFIHVYSLDGGITAWRKEGFPVEKRRIRNRK